MTTSAITAGIGKTNVKFEFPNAAVLPSSEITTFLVEVIEPVEPVEPVEPLELEPGVSISIPVADVGVSVVEFV
jgi:hypothetical protein